MISSSWDDRVQELDYLLRTKQIIKLRNADADDEEIQDDSFTLCELYHAGVIDIYEVLEADNLVVFVAEDNMNLAGGLGAVYNLNQGDLFKILRHEIFMDFHKNGIYI